MAKSAKNLTAADIMKRDVVVCSPQDSLRQAMELMMENHVTGIPVMDGRSRCVGLISASDILNYEQEHSDAEADGETAQHFDMDSQRWESVPVTSFGLEEFGTVSVEEVMTRDVIAVERDTPVKKVAKMMLEAKIHRVLVLNEKQSLYGIISASDFVGLVADL